MDNDYLAFFDVQPIVSAVHARYFIQQAHTRTGGDHGSKEEASDIAERKVDSAW